MDRLTESERTGALPVGVSVTLPAAALEAIARRAAELVLAQLPTNGASASPYLTIPEAAAYLRCKRQRVDDLLSSGRLTPYKEGRRTLILRSELEGWLKPGQRPRATPAGTATELVS